MPMTPHGMDPTLLRLRTDYDWRHGIADGENIAGVVSRAGMLGESHAETIVEVLRVYFGAPGDTPAEDKVYKAALALGEALLEYAKE